MAIYNFNDFFLYSIPFLNIKNSVNIGILFWEFHKKKTTEIRLNSNNL